MTLSMIVFNVTFSEGCWYL